jgi:hypothetical protein
MDTDYGWGSEPVWTLWIKDKYFVSAKKRTLTVRIPLLCRLNYPGFLSIIYYHRNSLSYSVDESCGHLDGR